MNTQTMQRGGALIAALILMFSAGIAFADINLDGITPEDQTVAPSAEVTYTVQGDTSPSNPGADNDWRSTRVTIVIPEGEDITQCVNEPDHTVGAANNATAQVTLNAPSDEGVYTVKGSAYRALNCSNKRDTVETTLTVQVPDEDEDNGGGDEGGGGDGDGEGEGDGDNGGDEGGDDQNEGNDGGSGDSQPKGSHITGGGGFTYCDLWTGEEVGDIHQCLDRNTGKPVKTLEWRALQGGGVTEYKISLINKALGLLYQAIQYVLLHPELQ